MGVFLVEHALFLLCVISASSASLRFTCFADKFTAEAQRTQRLRRESI